MSTPGLQVQHRMPSRPAPQVSRSLRLTAAAVVAVCAAFTGCAQAPKLELPVVPQAQAFKETGGSPWVAASSEATLAWDGWWKAYGDAELDALEQRLIDNSPDLASALARYDQARAATDSLRSAQSPTVNTSLNVQRDRQSERRPLRVLGPTSPDWYNSATLGLDASYELDLWGRVRQLVAGGVAAEAAARADLAAARLQLQAQLADSLVALRGLDQDDELLRDAEEAYGRALDLIERRHKAGIASGLDLARAQGQLEAAKSQRKQSQAQRAVMEHAIAALVGANASAFSIEPKAVALVVPVVPTGVPSTLLQRRPDIAAAQQRVAAATASLGVARTAYYPSFTLSGQGGFQTSDLAHFVEAPNLFWAIGPTLAFNLFDGGKRKADEARAEAALEETAQKYRGTVLTAFQQVEDQLALLDRYGQALESERANVAAADRSLALATNRYKAGAAGYLEVVTSQTAGLTARRTAADLATRQRRASVQLVRALGGGWDPAQASTQAQ
ncbi:efflux transporter, outer membrane factor (OMF) lipoprotein, NodT family [Roseateles sp. YR242]|uniref:efflux transporter outer membrane subunit n=1 Tax=Roseateles sp. YR242 TaxID=1855305 RepID=UPI0008D41EF8|nr:efflux transporter outer membrane subunit [Roseateles sp. YR242]SEL70245.1 efflux transporter, outer membrane factor (OMF) lipoprotein, NodT family [Roseateles sp. YR242]